MDKGFKIWDGISHYPTALNTKDLDVFDNLGCALFYMQD